MKIISNVIYLKLPMSRIDIRKQNNCTRITNRKKFFFFIEKTEFINTHFVETVCNSNQIKIENEQDVFFWCTRLSVLHVLRIVFFHEKNV